MSSEGDRQIYQAVVPAIQVNVSEEDFAKAKEHWHAQSRLAIAMLNDRIDPDQMLDGLYDVMGAELDPYLDEIVLGLEKLIIHA